MERARCIGVPILESQGAPIAAMSISGPKGRIDDDLIVTIADALWSASEEISLRLGYNTPFRNRQGLSRIDIDPSASEAEPV